MKPKHLLFWLACWTAIWGIMIVVVFVIAKDPVIAVLPGIGMWFGGVNFAAVCFLHMMTLGKEKD